MRMCRVDYNIWIICAHIDYLQSSLIPRLLTLYEVWARGYSAKHVCEEYDKVCFNT